MFKTTFVKSSSRYVSPVKFKALQNNLNGAKVTIDFRYLVRFDNYDIKTSIPIDSMTTRVPSGELRTDYKSFGYNTRGRSIEKDDIDDTYNVYKILDTMDDKLAHGFRNKLKHNESISRINHANIIITEDMCTYRAHVDSPVTKSEHIERTTTPVYMVTPAHRYTPQDDNNKVNYIYERTKPELWHTNWATTGKSVSLCSFIDHGLLMKSSISVTIKNLDDDTNELTYTQIKNTILEVLNTLNESFKEYGMYIDEMSVYHMNIERVKDAKVYSDNKELFYKFLDFIKNENIKLTNTSLTGDSIYSVVGMIRNCTIDSPELKQFNMAKKAFDVCVYTKTVNGQIHITEKRFIELCTRELSGYLYSTGGSFHLGTNDIKVIKRMYLMTTQNEKMSYTVCVPVDIFTKDIESVRELVKDAK